MELEDDLDSQTVTFKREDIIIDVAPQVPTDILCQVYLDGDWAPNGEIKYCNFTFEIGEVIARWIRQKCSIDGSMIVTRRQFGAYMRAADHLERFALMIRQSFPADMLRIQEEEEE